MPVRSGELVGPDPQAGPFSSGMFRSLSSFLALFSSAVRFEAAFQASIANGIGSHC